MMRSIVSMPASKARQSAAAFSGPKASRACEEAVGEAVVEVPAVAARGAEAHRLGLEHHDAAPRHGEAPRRAEAGEARADHRDIIAARDLPRRGRGEGRGACRASRA